MEKIQTFALAALILAFGFTGCLGDDTSDAKNEAPEAIILMPSQGSTVTAGEPFQIDDSMSTDPEDGTDLNYMWTLSGLGSPIDVSTKVTDTITIDNPGKDLILSLRVMDSKGLSGEDFVVINVEPGNRPPVATITSPSNGGAYSEGNEISFNGMASSDPDNDVLSYSWELGEVGGPTYTASREGMFDIELGEGKYSVTLTVEDPDGESSSTTHSFTVTNLPPIAKFSSDANSAFVGDVIEFSGEDSYDPEGDTLDFLWDFGDNKTSSLKSPEHSWSEAGTYTVKLTVEDGQGQEGTATKIIEIKTLGPKADFIFEVEGGAVEKVRANNNVTLDGSESMALGAPIKEYIWEFGEGEGEETTNESSIEYSWDLGGYYNVTLTVVDEEGKTGEITKILQVVPEDYLDEGQGNEVLDGNEDSTTYDMNVEIFVSSIELEFTNVNCVGGPGSSVDYNIFVQDSDGNSSSEVSGNIVCGAEGISWSDSFTNDDGALKLGDYQAVIEFSNGATAFQANWDYRFAITYDF